MASDEGNDGDDADEPVESKTLPPLIEPLIVQCLFVTGVGIEIEDQAVRFVGWVGTPDFNGGTSERRITVRFAMMDAAARTFLNDLRHAFERGESS